MREPSNTSLEKNIALNSIASIFYLFCSWITTVVVVVFSTNFEASGTLSVAMSVGNVFATIMLFKVRTVQTSDLQNEFSSKHYIAHRLLAFIAASILCFIYSLFTVEKSMLPCVCTYLLFKAGESFTDVLHGIYQRQNRFDYIALSQFCRGGLTLLPFCAVFILTQNLLYAISAMTVFTILYTIIVDLRLSSKLAQILPAFEKKSILNLTKRCIPGFLGLLFCTLTVSFVRQEYALSYGSELMGIYAAIAAPAVIVQAAATFIYTPLFGPIAESIQTKNTHKLRQIIIKFAAILAFLLIACIGAFYLFGEPVFTLIYGEKVRDYLYIMYALLTCTAITAFVSFLLDYLIILNCKISCLLTNLLSFIVATLLWQPLCGAFGMNGINFTIITAYALNSIIALVFILQKIKKLK